MLTLKHFSVLINNRPFIGPLDLNLRRGELLAITGPNGSGKSTLLRGILGLLPTKGSLFYCETKMNRLPATQVGYVPQRFNFLGSLPLTVREFLDIGAADLPDSQLCRELKITGIMDQSLGVLSGGELQRVVLARALARKPELLVLDEASAGIDALGQADILKLLLHLLEKHHLTIILVTHDVAELEHYKKLLGRKFHEYALGAHAH